MGAFVAPPGQPKPLQPGEFTSSAAPNVVSFAYEGIDPPTAIYIQRDDQLVIEGGTNSGGYTLTAVVRILQPNPPNLGQPDPAIPKTAPGQLPGVGNIVTAVLQVPLQASTGTPQLVQFPLMEGYLLSVAVTVNTTNQRGLVFCRVWINRGTLVVNNPTAAQLLIADYPTTFHPVSWPGGTPRFPTDGPGALMDNTVGNPGAGADWSFTLPNFCRARLQSFAATLTTSATVAARAVRAVLKDSGGNIHWQGGPSQTIPASTTAKVAAASGVFNATADATTVNIALPSPAMLGGGHTFGVTTANIQAGDQWSAIWYIIEQWVDFL